MTKTVDYKTGKYHQPEIDSDTNLLEETLSITPDRVLRIVNTWCADLHKKYNYAIKAEQNEKNVNRTDIKAIVLNRELDETKKEVKSFTQDYKLVGKIFMYPNLDKTRVTLSFFDLEWNEEVQEELEAKGFFNLTTIPHAYEIFKDLEGRLRVYALPEDPITGQIEDLKTRQEIEEKNVEHWERVVETYESLAEKLESARVALIKESAVKQNLGQKNILPPSYTEDLQKVKELSLIPLTINQISLRLGVSESTIKRYRKILGLSRHKK
jgi:hypothetical protein